ncbi:hypothetical protein PIB30_020953 [Stylosanthes scabra]|uniref:Uncharacterized protein n=1 Tax=Stylosanthes scabra TaxID=79078 RepID=A0ABU6R9A6_9FABA|nr:hypothetical protein [Stylosanthes scabra]
MKLERLDLSSNELEGEVPPSLGKLTSLHVLNLSNNHLHGKIPSTFSEFPMSSFLNNGFNLCGPPLLVLCRESSSSGKVQMSNTEVAAIIVAIVFTSTLICLVMLYVMLKIWCNWRKVAIVSSEEVDENNKREEGSRFCCVDHNTKNGGYLSMNSNDATSFSF